jgi:hypothetical protein
MFKKIYEQFGILNSDGKINLFEKNRPCMINGCNRIIPDQTIEHIWINSAQYFREKCKVCYCYKHPLKDELIKDYFELKIAEDELKIAANLDK